MGQGQRGSSRVLQLLSLPTIRLNDREKERERERERGSISGMQILNELMKIKNTPGEGVRLVSKTSCPPSFSPPLYP